MIGRLFMRLARTSLTNSEMLRHLMINATAVDRGSKHHHRRAFNGKRRLTEHSSLKKRMRVGEFKEGKLSPARKREFWHAAMRQRWNDISNLATKLEKDRARRTFMRLAA
jgi:hypothetical protein